MKDILGQENLNSIMQVAMSIVVFSLFLEAMGALFIYFSLQDIESFKDRGFFAVFHAISAYCNAGFSISSSGLYDESLRYNYYMQWVVMSLIVLGGLGYNIASNFIQYVKQFFINLFNRKRKKFISRVITLNTKIVIYTTIILIVAGTAFFLVSERSSPRYSSGTRLIAAIIFSSKLLSPRAIYLAMAASSAYGCPSVRIAPLVSIRLYIGMPPRLATR